jgi:hypothetical protein
MTRLTLSLTTRRREASGILRILRNLMLEAQARTECLRCRLLRDHTERDTLVPQLPGHMNLPQKPGDGQSILSYRDGGLHASAINLSRRLYPRSAERGSHDYRGRDIDHDLRRTCRRRTH